MSAGELIALEARQWINTPVIWGQTQKGRGCDCKGLVAGVFRELGRPEAESIYGLDCSYRPDRPVPTRLLKQGLEELFAKQPRGAVLEDGMILLLRVRGRAQHLAIVTDGGTRAVHADGWGSKRVRDRRLEALLSMFPLDAAFAVREQAEGF